MNKSTKTTPAAKKTAPVTKVAKKVSIPALMLDAPVTVIEATPTAGHAIPAGWDKIEADTPTGTSLVTEHEGQFVFTTTATALHDAHVAARPAPVPAKASGARVARAKFDADDALIEFVTMHGAAAWKTQKILDFVREQGFACGMSRLNRLMGRDNKGNALPVEAAKA